jgi:hypothetical protein
MIDGTQTLARLLEKLKLSPIPRSEVRKSDQKAVGNLVDLGFLSIKNKGNGQIMILDFCEGYMDWEKNPFPNGTQRAAKSGKNRSEATKSLRDSKLSSQTSPSLEIRLHNDSTSTSLGSVNWYYNDFQNLPLGSIVLIENLRTFLKSDILFPEYTFALRYDGIVSDKILELLYELKREVMIAPDYDPVGMLSYIRSKDILKEKVKLYIPKNIEHLFSISNRKLLALEKNKETLRGLLQRELDDDASFVIKLIQRHNAGLEQEGLHD